MNTKNKTEVSTSDLLPGHAPGESDQALTEAQQVRRYPDGSEPEGFNITAFGEGGSARMREEETGEFEACPYDEDTLAEFEWWKGYDRATDRRADSDDNGGARTGNR